MYLCQESFGLAPPSIILKLWQEKKLKLITSLEIINEYHRVGEILNKKYPGINVAPIIDLITVNSELYSLTQIEPSVCRDPDDDKFLAACLAADCKILISGDKDLLDISGYSNIQILKPSDFIALKFIDYCG